MANGQRSLRRAFIARFGPVYTTSGAVSAIADLKQRNTENAAAFMDRVKIAVDMLNYNVPEADRNAAFRQGYIRMVVAQFGGGLHEDLRAKVFGIPNPPATIDEALTAASAAEAEKTNQKLVVSLVDEAPKETSKPPEMTELEKISKGMQDVLAISRQGSRGQNSHSSRNRGAGGTNFSNYKCYNCNQMGHLRRQCPKPQTPFQSFGGGRGGPAGHGGGFTTRMGRYRQNFGPGRARPFFGRPPGRSMMEVGTEEFWGGEANQYHPYNDQPYGFWSQLSGNEYGE